MELGDYRSRPSERERTQDLMHLIPNTMHSSLDVGARDGFLSQLLTEHSDWVTALDLDTPHIDHDRIRCMRGDATALDFDDASFDLVLCAEVLEHLPGDSLGRACQELARVAREYVLIGVPYKQDIRLGRTTCRHCGQTNPPWGHVNSFDEQRLRTLFAGCEVQKISFVGMNNAQTNALSAMLLDLAGNPYGTYSQDEPCTHCGKTLMPPPPRKPWQRALTRTAVVAERLQRPFVRPHANWIHMLLRKRRAA